MYVGGEQCFCTSYVFPSAFEVKVSASYSWGMSWSVPRKNVVISWSSGLTRPVWSPETYIHNQAYGNNVSSMTTMGQTVVESRCQSNFKGENLLPERGYLASAD